MLQVVEMRLFGRKKKEESKVVEYEIFGGATIERVEGGYEITWRSPNLTTIRTRSKPRIDDNVEAVEEADRIQVLTKECRLRLVSKDGVTEAYISKL